MIAFVRMEKVAESIDLGNQNKEKRKRRVPRLEDTECRDL